MQKPENKARQFICFKLGISNVATEVRLILQRPSFADGRLRDPSTLMESKISIHALITGVRMVSHINF
jgi:hypothetical protein